MLNPHSENSREISAPDLARLADAIKRWGRELEFAAVGISAGDTTVANVRLRDWLKQGRHGDMSYMARHADLRAEPRALLPAAAPAAQLRVCTDTAPVFEVEFARAAGLGWRGKHTLLLTQDAGSMFFLGEIITDLALPIDLPASEHCGTCSRCIDVCPTQAIVAPYELDSRRCISYLTIEHKAAIPEALRPLIGNRVYGCDDCQLVCPWNKFARTTRLPDFDVRNGLDRATLIDLFGWSETQFRDRHAGSAILRIGFERWLRNLAVGLGNARKSAAVVQALRSRADAPSALVREHVAWALSRHDSEQA